MRIKSLSPIVLLFMLLGSMACKKNDNPGTKPPVIKPIDTANLKEGVTFFNNGTTALIKLYAPNKIRVSVIGDFNEWNAEATPMKKMSNPNYWLAQVDGLNADQEYAYQYLINNSLRVADPYTEKILDPNNDQYIPATVYPGLKTYPSGKTTEIVSVMQANQPAYSWKINNFTRPAKSNLVIYELLVRDFVATHSYKTLTDTLGYLKRLGVNAIELMPVSEFEGNESWGYNVSFFFAPDKYYGTKNDLKAFIDACHQNGMAVIMDVVLNHAFGSSPMVRMYFDQATGKTSSANPWFNVNPTHPFNVGYDFNHESQATRRFSKSVMRHWLQEYKIDGYRFDLSKGFTQKNNPDNVDAWSAYDASRIAIWKDYNNYIKSVDPNAYVILEHFAADQEEKELAADGMMLWNNVSYGFQEANMGWIGTSDLSRLVFKSHGFTTVENLVGFAESHDEERTSFKTTAYGNTSGYNVRLLANNMKRNEMSAAFLLATPGPKMIWQFGELGYDISIDQNGRTGNKPILWNYTTVPARASLYNKYSKYISMKLKNAVFNTTDVTSTLNDALKTLKLSAGGVDVMVIGNYDVIAKTTTAQFTKTGTWYDYDSGGTVNITNVNTTMTLNPGEYHIFSSAKLQ